MSDVPSWVTYTTLAIAGLALVRPEFTRVYRHWRRRLNASLNEKINISYGPSASLISLTGTLRAISDDVFVEKMTAKVVRLADNAEHHFDWYLSSSLGLSQNASSTELVAAFNVSKSAPYKFNFALQDAGQLETVSEVYGTYEKQWQDELKKLQKIGGPGTQISAQKVNQEIDRFIKGPEHVAAYKAFDKANYWHAGNYSLKLNWMDEKGDLVALGDYKFSLTSEESERLSWAAAQIPDIPINIFKGLPGPNWLGVDTKLVKVQVQSKVS